MRTLLIAGICFGMSISNAATSNSTSNLEVGSRSAHSKNLTTRSGEQARARRVHRLTDQQATKCVYSDKATESIYQDVQAVYGLDMIKAKEFYQIMISAKSCPELKANLRKLRQQIMARFPTTPMKSPTASTAGAGTSSSSSGSSSSPYSSGSGTTAGSFGSPSDAIPYDPPFPGEYYGPPSDAYGGFPDDDLDF